MAKNKDINPPADKKGKQLVLARPGPKEPQNQFSIKHYADTEPVAYLGENFLTKNSAKVWDQTQPQALW